MIYALITLISALLLVSAAFNLFFYRKWQSAKKAPTPSIELQDFMADLMTGKLGMVAVARVDQSQLLLRSPRGNQ